MASFVKHQGEWVVSLPNKVPKDFRATVKKKDGSSVTVIVGDLLVDDENKTLYRFSNLPTVSSAPRMTFGEKMANARHAHGRYQRFLGEHAGDQFESAADDRDYLGSLRDGDDFDEHDRYNALDYHND